QERVRLELRLGVGAGQLVLRQPYRVGQVTDVEQRDLCAGGPALGGGVLPDADQPGGVGRVQVGRVARDLQLALDGRPGRVTEVQCVQRVGLAERHHVADRDRKSVV